MGNKWKWKNNSKPLGLSESSAKQKVHSNTGLPQETRKKSNKKPMYDYWKQKLLHCIICFQIMHIKHIWQLPHKLGIPVGYFTLTLQRTSFTLIFYCIVEKENSWISSVQSLSRVRLCDPMNRSMPGLPVDHQLPEFTQTHVYRVSDFIQPSHPLSFPSCPAPCPSQHQSLFQCVNSLHEVAKVLELQL